MSMAPAQAEKQLAFLAANLAWPDPPSAAILAGGAICSPLPASDLISELTTPFAVVHRGRLVGDREHPERYVEASFDVEVCVENWEAYGAAAAIGIDRESVGQSGGRGADEVLGEIRSLLYNLTSSQKGISAFVTEDAPSAAELDGVAYLFATFTVTVYNARTGRFYHPCYGFLATGGAGQVALSWTAGPLRWDSYNFVVRRSSAGGAAIQLPTDGSPVALSSSLATSVTVTGLTPGTYQFGIFASYDEVNSPTSTASRYSAVAQASAVAT